ncbi:MAG: MFS transporter [Gemmataceae bacterium]|nr:MFS transporter [Gemmataceae bacterium]
MATFQPAGRLSSRTFIALLTAQFFAAFNDQAIHASAMFFAINTGALAEDQAISLMPILFYAPWALFCTLSGYLADKYSKRHSLVFWKLAEVVITAVALVGFWLGTHQNALGPWIVLSTVFLMGMHSAFFVPAKYGVMPEILQSHLLSRGNGLLESLSFLAVILGTVFGGVLSYQFRGEEYWIGIVLFILAIIGAAASFFIEKVPAASPEKKFPEFLYAPVWKNLKEMFLSRPLALAVVGIAFFTFIVAFTRATVYMHGESQIPRWTELKTSAVVGMVALGIGIGSPLVGFLSGGKIEIGLVPIGILGMVGATVANAVFLDSLPATIICIILNGFFTGFYVVPLFTLLQHRAPKASKGDAVATSNLVNVTGAIFASVLFFLIVKAAHFSGLCPEIKMEKGYHGTLIDLKLAHGRPDTYTLEIEGEKGQEKKILASGSAMALDAIPAGIAVGSKVWERTYQKGQVEHRKLALEGDGGKVIFDNEKLPRYLFLGAGIITLSTLFVLRLRMPDLLLRTILWGYLFKKMSLRAHGLHQLPGRGGALLVHSGNNLEDSLCILSATDRTARSLYCRGNGEGDLPPLLNFLAQKYSLAWLEKMPTEETAVVSVVEKGRKNLKARHVVSMPLDGPWAEPLLKAAEEYNIPVIAVSLNREVATGKGPALIVHVTFHPPVKTGLGLKEVQEICQNAEAGWVSGGIPAV